MNKYKVITPDYYKLFTCKCGECRTPCCGNWNISLTKEEYFRLVGMSLPKELRHKLDCALILTEQPYDSHYASISPDYKGFCPIMDSEGYCTLQRKYGENVLPLVCRMYPRSFKRGEINELCISGSCENTIELLMSSVSPLSFEELELSLPFGGIDCLHTQTPDTIEMRKKCLGIISDRTLPLRDRLSKLLTELTGRVCVPCNRSESLVFITDIIEKLEKLSPSLYAYGSDALVAMGITEENAHADYKAYEEALKSVRERYQNFDIYIEKILANHMFYTQFPYVSKFSTFAEAFKDFCICCAVTVFITVCRIYNSDKDTDFPDTVSEAMRFFEHSFYYTSEFTFPHGMTEDEKDNASLSINKVYNIL